MSVQLLQTQKALATAQGTFQQSLSSVRAELSESTENNEAVGADVIQRMEELSAEQVKVARSSNKGDPKQIKAKNQKITHLTQVASLQTVVVNVLTSDLLGKEKEGQKASELLLSTKSGIWKLSEKWSKNKEALRGLMAPIDILASKWKRGDYSGDTKRIQKTLQDILAAQAKS